MFSNDLGARPSPFIKEIAPPSLARCLTALADLPHVAFLDSAAPSGKLGRYSYLAADPFGILTSRDDKAFWNGDILPDAPLIALQKALDTHQLTSVEADIPPFQGGAIGYFAYEAGRLLEHLPTTSRDQDRLPDLHLPFYDVILAVDHFADGPDAAPRDRAWILSSGYPERGEARAARARLRLKCFRDLLQNPSNPSNSNDTPPAITGWRSNFTRQAFEAAIEKTRTHIRDGDIFQANITQCFSACLPAGDAASPLAYYLQLRRQNAAPFAAYLDCGDHVIASSSPERFVTLDAKGCVETRPIKGTAPRDLTDPARDADHAATLQASDKDRAENIMITDLMRNDLSRVCKAGTIKVPDLCTLESYARVHHLVSSVTGEMKEGLGAVSLLGATFPGGSITGAPKIRAMEIITELEDLPRGVYCGAIGYLGFNGAMDTNIAIRTVTFRDDKVQFHTGGGITILSDPSAEYEECLHKAAALFRGLGTSVEAERDTIEARSKPVGRDGS
ncbi:aminodeoxychorismate synthase component I [Cohaesibacter intestini]|uniref:aminodeoxychorismate synthase component I n=1 Tax=Cohaesibacter intestini TaxID=2211145 RepID=UPI000DE91D4F|nr:aminodeoxychorismate synthase component I [Cohaesibacter intestini]